MRLCPLLLLASAAVAPAADDPLTRERIVDAMRRVHRFQSTHPWRKTDRNWIRATYYTGVMALYRTTADPKVLEQATAWAGKHAWAAGNEREKANRKTCGQTWLELYFIDPKPHKIAPIRAYVDSRIAAVSAGEKPRDAWYYCDTLFVGPPTIAMLGKATGQARTFDYLNRVYWDVADHLLDKQAGLFYRDKRFFKARTPHGRKVFWSRGNGWVIGGIPRVLEYLPADNPRRADYIALLRTMAAALAKRQGGDGLWRASLDDPRHVPNPETSGSAFFCYAMAWGIRENILPPDDYLPVAVKAWRGLVACVQDDGRLGYVQPVGDRPAPATAQSTHEYATGAFLLAGSEMARLAAAGVLKTAQGKPPRATAP